MLPVIPITSDFLIPTYLLVISLVYCGALYWVYLRSKLFQVSHQDALDLSLALMLGGFLGARAAHVLYENPMYYFEHPVEVFYFWQGGYVFYGGFLGAFLFAWALARYKNFSPLFWMDFFAPVIALGYGLGRLSCFFAGCCYGKQTDVFWALPLRTISDIEPVLRHPTQLYAVFWELVLFVFLITIERKKRNSSSYLNPILKQPGLLFVVWLFYHGLGRVIMEHYRDDDRGAFIGGTSVSTAMSVVLMSVASVIFIKTYFQLKKGK